MSDSAGNPVSPSDEQRYLRRGLRRIIIGQEVGPRTPRWRAAWKRTLMSYVDRLGQLGASPERDPEE
jgi:hypothetical protein